MIKIPLYDGNNQKNTYLDCANNKGLPYAFYHPESLTECLDSGKVVLSDLYLPNASLFSTIDCYAWLMEPRVIHPEAYKFVEKHSNLFKRIYSHDIEFCRNIQNAVYYPWGTCRFSDEQQLLYTKTHNVSMVCSNKRSSVGHQFRHECIEKVKQKLTDYIHGGKFSDKFPLHKGYMFSVVVENCRNKGYFTEKIIDCFRTGVVPIYWGDPIIGKWFNINGILTFNSVDELDRILDQCDLHLYNKLNNFVIENFYRASRYLHPWIAVINDIIVNK